MAVPTRVASYLFREFDIVVAKLGSTFSAVGFEHKSRNKVAAIQGALSEADAKRDIEAELCKQSFDFVDLVSAQRLFLKAFPTGFESPRYIEEERTYKDRTAIAVCMKLGSEAMLHAIERREFARICADALSTINNLVFKNERISLGEALKRPEIQAPFATALHNMLYADFRKGFVELSNVLRPHNAAKWTILTYWMFFRYPDDHIFIKPTIYRNCTQALGVRSLYESEPNLLTYDAALHFARHLKANLTELRPRDHIDVQSFMFIVGDEANLRAAVMDQQVLEPLT